jgi:hypothetical protein
MSAVATREHHTVDELDEVPNCCGVQTEAATCCLRHYFEKLAREGTNAGDVALWAGYVNKNRADGTRVRRLLGIIETNPDRTPDEPASFRATLPYTDAVQLTLKMGLDPVDLGL